MNRNRLIGTAAALLAAAGTALFAGSPSPPNGGSLLSVADAADTGAPLYYQDPDGKPLYSPTPKQTRSEEHTSELQSQ